MRGQVGGVAGDGPPTWRDGAGVEAAEEIASLRDVDRLVRAIRAARASRTLRERRDADMSRRLVREALDDAVIGAAHPWQVPIDADRRSR